jgi:alpha-L-fucosidase
MPSRREFCQSLAGAAAFAMIPQVVNSARPSGKTVAYRQDKPLHQLQQEFLDLRFGMFLHYNMATYQDREWGDPRGDTRLFDPTYLDTDQWAAAAKSAGMTYGCLTTKHHDGFCIWPTKTKADSILQTDKKIDVVKAYADSFRRAGLKVGLYFSILDLRGDIRHHNVTPEKIQLIKDQLSEILSNYGEINVLVIDGWDAPWSRITYEEIPFDEIYAHIKELQPNCLICELNASQYPASALYYTDIKAFEQNAGQVVPGDSTIPALSCVTLSDGWFWKVDDDHAELKAVNQVVNEWLVPLNNRFCNLICNAAPNREGRLSPNLVRRLEEIGRAWKHAGPMAEVDPALNVTTTNLATGQPIRASFSPDTVGPDMANDGDFKNSWYLPDEESEGWVEIDFREPTTFNTFTLVEPIGRFGDYTESRFETWKLEVDRGSGWEIVALGAWLSRVHLERIDQVTAKRMRLSFTASDKNPHLAEIGVYLEQQRS